MRSVWYGYSVRIVIMSLVGGSVAGPRRWPKIAASPSGCLPPARAKVYFASTQSSPSLRPRKRGTIWPICLRCRNWWFMSIRFSCMKL